MMRRTARNLSMALLLFAASTGCDEPRESSSVVIDNTAKTTAETVPEAARKAAETPQNLDVAKEDGTLHESTDEQIRKLEAAKEVFFAGDMVAAERAFEKVIETGPLSSQKVSAYVALAQIYRETERPKRAVELLEELTEKAPRIPEGHFMLGRTYAETGESTRAIKAYEKTLNMQPDYLQAYVELGGMYQSAGRTTDAQNILFKYEKKIYDLAGKLESPDTPPEDKLHILDVFSFIDDDRASAAILTALGDPEPTVRERAVYLAADFRLGDARPILQTLTEDPNVRVRMAAKEALSQLADAPTGTASPSIVRD